jgi:hypothetical protein
MELLAAQQRSTMPVVDYPDGTGRADRRWKTS